MYALRSRSGGADGEMWCVWRASLRDALYFKPFLIPPSGNTCLAAYNSRIFNRGQHSRIPCGHLTNIYSSEQDATKLAASFAHTAAYTYSGGERNLRCAALAEHRQSISPYASSKGYGK
ncbi:hypothetical protein KSX_29250 [Ktedonospora formicarum]|uniref:Uncharacterized protein n=1 Tax=Ktedonospora formicarum TaxID=2778364 RepID=A0A8J3HVE5_9CHLR|nr:hypothetical protein KSX_29250 [Ktedonospora formicarum]